MGFEVAPMTSREAFAAEVSCGEALGVAAERGSRESRLMVFVVTLLGLEVDPVRPEGHDGQ